MERFHFKKIKILCRVKIHPLQHVWSKVRDFYYLQIEMSFFLKPNTACGTAHIRLHFREAEMQHPLRISARGNAQLSVHFLKRGQELK